MCVKFIRKVDFINQAVHDIVTGRRISLSRKVRKHDRQPRRAECDHKVKVFRPFGRSCRRFICTFEPSKPTKS